jgi:hypothetical protein
MASKGKVGYPSDISDEEWAFVLPYLLLSREDSAHREHDLRSVFNGVRSERRRAAGTIPPRCDNKN